MWLAPVKGVMLIKFCYTPICNKHVYFFSLPRGVECDLNINNLVGIRNTHLLRHYAYMDWRVRPLILFIKKWARFHDINDATGIKPPVLPCLQQMKPEMFSQKIDVRKLSLSLHDKPNFTSLNQATLGELFLGFLNYYSFVFSYNNEVISIRKGKSMPLGEVRWMGDQMQWKFLNIEVLRYSVPLLPPPTHTHIMSCAALDLPWSSRNPRQLATGPTPLPHTAEAHTQTHTERHTHPNKCKQAS
ncbi:poly(A) RNA polymerase gld-2-like protein A [Elysia marginata]|uniref:Poly(A) RNA polymerase gld-2-like protein A n=1 Tax=Elysia marginata TaxID=1093978 RepID=A0AAV4J766_9GAST|nr:poly(A) RNA polymerase gld-2-like protein A [Elysia marginata]